MLCVCYKWTLSYVDSLTWPEIDGMLNMIVKHPPTDVVLPQMLKSQMTQKVDAASSVKESSIPYKKGKVGVKRKTDGN